MMPSMKRNKVQKKAKKNDEMTNDDKPSHDHRVYDITCEDKINDDEYFYELLDQAIITNNNLKLTGYIGEKPRNNIGFKINNLGCQLCHFEYPRPIPDSVLTSSISLMYFGMLNL
ncbi:hypothetical protein HAX54_037575 [Datura stramonium]|uniref:Uncharacterized protein n=1 Tax=Datura stramonium TaxID=4076 RepID=A0ABS8VLH0_DATST|nr:hypothetical protein [Datura stramonium]